MSFHKATEYCLSDGEIFALHKSKNLTAKYKTIVFATLEHADTKVLGFFLTFLSLISYAPQSHSYSLTLLKLLERYPASPM